MARLTVPDRDQTLDAPEAIAAFLEPFGIQYERWEVGGRVADDAPADAILAAYGPEIERLKARGGYVVADVIDVTPATEGLEAMLDRFRKEHTHSEDEVRFIVRGRGVFHIRPERGDVFAIQLDAGDLINVPAGTRHWFDLCGDRTIRAIRLFLDRSGWAPHYVEDPVHSRYTPVCWGPEYLPSLPRLTPAIRP